MTLNPTRANDLHTGDSNTTGYPCFLCFLLFLFVCLFVCLLFLLFCLFLNFKILILYGLLQGTAITNLERKDHREQL